MSERVGTNARIHRRRILTLTALFLGATLAMIGSGCSSFNRDLFKNRGNQVDLSKQLRPVEANQVIERISSNASKVKNLRSDLSIVAMNFPRTNGRLWMEGDRDFRLKVEYFNKQLADLGSNQEGFWFWVTPEDKNQKEVLVCSYDEQGDPPVAFQPDWIVEALGLKPFTDEERKSINVEKGAGEYEGLLILTRNRTNSEGMTIRNVTYVDQKTGQIREHRLYGQGGRTLIAMLKIERHQAFKIPITSNDSADYEESTVTLPQKFRLVWNKTGVALDSGLPLQTDLSMEVELENPTINGQIARNAFMRPEFKDHKHIDIRSLAASYRSQAPEGLNSAGVSNGQSNTSPSRNRKTNTSDQNRDRDDDSSVNESNSSVASNTRRVSNSGPFGFFRKNGVVAASKTDDSDRGGRTPDDGKMIAKPIKPGPRLMDQLIGARYPRGPLAVPPPREIPKPF